MSDDPNAIAERLKPTLKRALLSRPGSGSFSTGAWHKLMDAGLMDDHFWPTDLGFDVRKALGAKDQFTP